MTQKTALITGSSGAIGEGLCHGFKGAGWRVVGVDAKKSDNNPCDIFLPINLDEICQNEAYFKNYISKLDKAIPSGLEALINNAATQIISPIEELRITDWLTTMNVNLNSVFLLTKTLLPKLKRVKGNVINITSIHAKLTKANFSAYATSKAGLVGLTQSFAVELGGQVQVNSICPAAISTPMLEDGFKGKNEKRLELDSFHPCKSIGVVDDIVSAALYLVNESSPFINGTTVNLDGGISSRLHDPE